MLGSSSLSYMSIKPDLENMDLLAEIILEDLRTNPTSWIEEVRRHQTELIESFYLTVTDKEKVSWRNVIKVFFNLKIFCII